MMADDPEGNNSDKDELGDKGGKEKEKNDILTPDQRARSEENRKRALEIKAAKKASTAEVAVTEEVVVGTTAASSAFQPWTRSELSPKKLFIVNPYKKKIDPYKKKKEYFLPPVKKKKLFPVFCGTSSAKEKKENKGSEFDDKDWDEAAMKMMDDMDVEKRGTIKPVKPASKEVSGLSVVSVGQRYNSFGVKIEKFKCEIGVKCFDLTFNIEEPVKKLMPRLKCECGVPNCDCGPF